MNLLFNGLKSQLCVLRFHKIKFWQLTLGLFLFRISRSKLFYKKNDDMKTGTTYNFIKMKLRCRCFPVNFGIFQEQLSYRTPLGDCSCLSTLSPNNTKMFIFNLSFTAEELWKLLRGLFLNISQYLQENACVEVS